MSPYRQQHSCLIDETITNVVEVRAKDTMYGKIRVVLGKNAKGQLKVRSLRIPSTVAVQQAKSLCIARGGRFQPATPIDPKRQLLGEINLLSPCNQKQVFDALIEDFEMPLNEIRLADWSTAEKNELPDSAFITVLPGGKKDASGRTVPRSKRLLPYKNSSGKIDKGHVQNALARVNQISAPASVKKMALSKLLRITRALGMKVQEKSKFKLASLEFYLTQRSLLEEV